MNAQQDFQALRLPHSCQGILRPSSLGHTSLVLAAADPLGCQLEDSEFLQTYFARLQVVRWFCDTYISQGSPKEGMLNPYRFDFLLSARVTASRLFFNS